MADQKKILYVSLSLAALYIIWSSTFLMIKFTIRDIPPFLMSGLRYLLAGCLLYPLLKYHRYPTPSKKEWRNAAIVSIFLLLGGTGFLALAEQWVSSGVAAIDLASIPALTCLFSLFAGEKRTRTEWIGVIIGLAGIVVLNFSREMTAQFPGNIIISFSPILWSIGAVMSRHMALPKGLMASATQMITGGIITIIVGLLIGERILHMPSQAALGGFMFLTIFGSLIAFSAFTYLIGNTSPALATSYAFVNPVIAVLLGIYFAKETLGIQVGIALCLVVVGVAFVVLGQKKQRLKKIKS